MIIVSALSLSLRDKEREREKREIEIELDNEFQIINTDNVTIASLFLSFDDEDAIHIGTGDRSYLVLSISFISFPSLVMPSQCV